MPYRQCFFRIAFFRLIIVAIAGLSFGAYGSEWRECEKAKLQQLKLQRRSESHAKPKRTSVHRSEDRRQRAEEIDAWLWKNCREFSYELRQLEQDNM